MEEKKDKEMGKILQRKNHQSLITDWNMEGMREQNSKMMKILSCELGNCGATNRNRELEREST